MGKQTEDDDWKWKVIRTDDGVTVAQGAQCPTCHLVVHPDFVDGHKCRPETDRQRS